MKPAILYTLLGALTLTCLGQGYYIYTHKRSSETAPDRDWSARAERLDRDVKRSIRRGETPPPAVFDDFFDDEFFGRKFDPFAEMEHVHERMAELFRRSERSMLDTAWKDWREERMGLDAFKTDIRRTDASVVLTMEVPGLAGKTADIDINEDRIRISFTARDVRDKKSGRGTMHQESSRSYMKVLPIPADAAASSARTEIKDDRITITFDKQ